MNQDSTRTPTTSFGEEELCPLIRNILPVICVSSPQSGGVSTPKSKREVTAPASACQPNLPLRVLIELQYSRHNLQNAQRFQRYLSSSGLKNERKPRGNGGRRRQSCALTSH